MIPSDLGPREPTTPPQVNGKDKTYNVRADLLAGDLVVCDHDSEIEDNGESGGVSSWVTGAGFGGAGSSAAGV